MAAFKNIDGINLQHSEVGDRVGEVPLGDPSPRR